MASKKKKKWSPFGRNSGVTIVSEEDMKYLKGEPAPLVITIPVVIEEDPDWKRAGFSSEEEYQKYLTTKPKDEPFK